MTLPNVRLSGTLCVVLLLAGTLPGDATAQARDPRAGEPRVEDRDERDERCADLSEEERRRTERCKTEAERREDAYQERLEEIAERERPTRSSFLERIHLDGLWVPTQSGVSTFGLVGVHLAVANIGRVHLFGPPGVLVMLESRSGQRLLRPAFTWGVSIYLTDFRVPVAGRSAELYLNLTKVWTRSAESEGLNVAGLSMTWKRNP